MSESAAQRRVRLAEIRDKAIKRDGLDDPRIGFEQLRVQSLLTARWWCECPTPKRHPCTVSECGMCGTKRPAGNNLKDLEGDDGDLRDIADELRKLGHLPNDDSDAG